MVIYVYELHTIKRKISRTSGKITGSVRLGILVRMKNLRCRLVNKLLLLHLDVLKLLAANHHPLVASLNHHSWGHVAIVWRIKLSKTLPILIHFLFYPNLYRQQFTSGVPFQLHFLARSVTVGNRLLSALDMKVEVAPLNFVPP